MHAFEFVRLVKSQEIYVTLIGDNPDMCMSVKKLNPMHEILLFMNKLSYSRKLSEIFFSNLIIHSRILLCN